MKLLSVSVFLFLFFSLTCYGQQDSTSSEVSLPICVFETQPSFPGGMKSLLRFIQKNLVYPKHEFVEGTVYVSVMINEDGSLSDFIIVKGLNDQCDKSAIDVFRKMPGWIPAKQDGKPVKIRMVLPIKFTHS